VAVVQRGPPQLAVTAKSRLKMSVDRARVLMGRRSSHHLIREAIMQACVRKEPMHASGALCCFHACYVAQAGACGLETSRAGVLARA